MKEDNELSYMERQVTLYFKLHFKITDMIEDLKVFVGREYALHIDQVEINSIYHFVVQLYFKLIKLNIINLSYGDFVSDLFRYEIGVDQIGMIKKLRALIQGSRTSGVLGEPDYSLLPKYEKESIKV